MITYTLSGARCWHNESSDGYHCVLRPSVYWKTGRCKLLSIFSIKVNKLQILFYELQIFLFFIFLGGGVEGIVMFQACLEVDSPQ